jgi:hypothetical protein
MKYCKSALPSDEKKVKWNKKKVKAVPASDSFFKNAGLQSE